MNDDKILTLHMEQMDEEALVTRSQAKRVARRFERFKRVELDFAGVPGIGQAFADELFRVYAAAHPAIRISAVNTEPAVDRMIRRAVVAGAGRATGKSAHAVGIAPTPPQPPLNRIEAAQDVVEKEYRP